MDTFALHAKEDGAVPSAPTTFLPYPIIPLWTGCDDEELSLVPCYGGMNK